MKKSIYVLTIGTLFLNIVFADSVSVEKKKQNEFQLNKNGFFVGVEAVLGGAYKKGLKQDDASSTTFDLGILGGYQHYFDIEQKHGIKTSLHLHSGFGNNFDDTSSVSYGTYAATPTNYHYVPLKVGFDVKYLWDFFQKGKQTLGLSVGLGYEADWFFDTTPAPATPASKYAKAKTDTTPKKNLFIQNIYPTIGIHYYYSHHQIELLGNFLQGNLSQANITPILLQEYLTLNYTYRF